MRISCKTNLRRADSGYALMITLLFLTVSLMTMGSVLYWASSNAKVTQQNELFTSAEAAAEAATEQVVATMDRDWTYGQSLSSASVYGALIPVQTGWPRQYQFGDGSGNVGKTGVTIGVEYFTNSLGSSFTNLSGNVQDCTITSTAIASNQIYTVSATVQQVLHATIIPLFQFAVFYNLNCEIDPGAAMTMNGPVFSNMGLWAGTANITFNNMVAAVGLVYDQVTDTTNDNPWCTGKTDTGTPTNNFTLKGQPESKVDSLTLPIGTNNSASAVEAILNLPSGTNGAPNPGAYTTNNQIYLFNECDILISNSVNGVANAMGTNLTVWFQDPNNSSALTQVNPDIYVVTNRTSHTSYVTNYVDSSNTNVISASYSFATNVSYYDFRESNTVQAVQLNISNLTVWLDNTNANGGEPYNSQNFSDKGHGIDSVYVYNNAPNNATTLPAVRLVNGAQLPYTSDPNGTGRTTGGLTVATPDPLYVEGNYNVQTNGGTALASAGTTNTLATYPASIMGDAITILSANWRDTNAPGQPLGTRQDPSATTVNAACLEGIVVSTNSNYSGGLENFLRLEEDWSGVTLQYNGSIVVMFPSIYATNHWQQTGSYYNPPTRRWGFDYNFTNPNKLPPLTPKFYKIIRGTWTAT